MKQTTSPTFPSPLSFLASTCALLLGAAPASAQLSFTIQPTTEGASKDTKIFTHGTAQSDLTVTSLDLGEHFLGLVQFDLSSLNGLSASSITNATFTLYSPGFGMTGGSAAGGNVTVSPILDAWRETTAEAGTAPVATYPAFFGATPTLHFGSAAASRNVTAGGFIDWDITNLVKAWVSGATANNGVIFQTPDSGQVDISFADVDSSPTVPGSAPKLSVLAVPEPSAIGLSLLGAVGLGLRRRRSLSA